MSRISKPALWAIAITALATSVYLFFHRIIAYIDKQELSGLPRDFTIVLLGVILTVSITMLLLTQQTRQEENRDKNVELFRKKFELFTEFLEVIRQASIDGRFSKAEIQELTKWSWRISLVAGSDLSFQVASLLHQARRFPVVYLESLSAEERAEWEQWVEAEMSRGKAGTGEFIAPNTILEAMRADLGSTSLGDEDDSFIVGALLADTAGEELAVDSD